MIKQTLIWFLVEYNFDMWYLACVLLCSFFQETSFHSLLFSKTRRSAFSTLPGMSVRKRGSSSSTSSNSSYPESPPAHIAPPTSSFPQSSPTRVTPPTTTFPQSPPPPLVPPTSNLSEKSRRHHQKTPPISSLQPHSHTGSTEHVANGWTSANSEVRSHDMIGQYMITWHALYLCYS